MKKGPYEQTQTKVSHLRRLFQHHYFMIKKELYTCGAHSSMYFMSVPSDRKHTFCSNWPGVLKCIQAGFAKLSIYSSAYYIPHFSSCVYLSAKPSFLLMREMCIMLRIIVMLDFGPSEDIHGKLKRLIHLSSLNNDDLEVIQSNIPLRIFAHLPDSLAGRYSILHVDISAVFQQLLLFFCICLINYCRGVFFLSGYSDSFPLTAGADFNPLILQ